MCVGDDDDDDNNNNNKEIRSGKIVGISTPASLKG